MKLSGNTIFMAASTACADFGRTWSDGLLGADGCSVVDRGDAQVPRLRSAATSAQRRASVFESIQPPMHTMSSERKSS